MIAIRNNEMPLRRGSFIALTPSSADAVTFLRKYKSQGVIVASNLAASPINNLTITVASGTFPAGNYTLTDQLTNAQINLVVNANGGISNQSLGNMAGRTTVVYKMVKY